MDLQTIRNVFERLAQCKDIIMFRGISNWQNKESIVQPYKCLTQLQQ